MGSDASKSERSGDSANGGGSAAVGLGSAVNDPSSSANYHHWGISNSRDPTLHGSAADSSSPSKQHQFLLGIGATSSSTPTHSQQHQLYHHTTSASEGSGKKFYGLHNIGNTCYCNSVLQALHSFEPFRRNCLKYRNNDGNGMLGVLADLFWQIESAKKRTGALVPKKFIQRLRYENELFRSSEHHDAHEFYNYLINNLAETLSSPQCTPESATWVHQIFQGMLIYQTRCLCCESVTKREEPFFDLSIDIFENSSVTACIDRFKSPELLRKKEKYFCDKCACLQEAQRTLCLGRLPKLLTIHLKRFRFVEDNYSRGGGRYERLPYRVSFSNVMELSCVDQKRRSYELLAVVVHIGMSMSHGHYVCCIRTSDQWMLFDDHQVQPITENDLESFFGASDEFEGIKCGYLLFYKAIGDEEERCSLAKQCPAASAIPRNNGSSSRPSRQQLQPVATTTNSKPSWVPSSTEAVMSVSGGGGEAKDGPDNGVASESDAGGGGGRRGEGKGGHTLPPLLTLPEKFTAKPLPPLPAPSGRSSTGVGPGASKTASETTTGVGEVSASDTKHTTAKTEGHGNSIRSTSSSDNTSSAAVLRTTSSGKSTSSSGRVNDTTATTTTTTTAAKNNSSSSRKSSNNGTSLVGGSVCQSRGPRTLQNPAASQATALGLAPPFYAVENYQQPPSQRCESGSTGICYSSTFMVTQREQSSSCYPHQPGCGSSSSGGSRQAATTTATDGNSSSSGNSSNNSSSSSNSSSSTTTTTTMSPVVVPLEESSPQQTLEVMEELELPVIADAAASCRSFSKADCGELSSPPSSSSRAAALSTSSASFGSSRSDERRSSRGTAEERCSYGGASCSSRLTGPLPPTTSAVVGYE